MKPRFVPIASANDLQTLLAPMNQEPFDKLLEWLERDREQAAQKYESIRQRLVRSYVCNGCGDDAQELADKTIDRVMRKLEKGEIPTPYVGNKAHYFLGCAPYIRQEYFRERSSLEVTPEMKVSNHVDDDAEDRDACLEECMSTVEAEDRWLAVEYYRFEKSTKREHRKKIAEQVQLSIAGLRTRVFRIREELRPCIEECLERRLTF